MATVLIAGGTGYLGSHLARAFVEEGFDVAVLKRRASSLARLQPVLQRVALQELDDHRWENEIARRRPQLVIHAVTCYGRRGESQAQIAEANVVLPSRLLNAAVRAGTRAFVNVDTILPPQVGDYARTKHMFHRHAVSRLRDSGTALVNIRMANMYGPWDDDMKFTTSVIRACAANQPSFDLTGGDQRRDFVYIDDAVSAFVMVAHGILASDRPQVDLDLATGVATPIRSFAEMAHRLTRSTTQLNFGAMAYRPGDPMESPLDAAALAALGWRARYDVASGIAAIIGAEGLR